MKTARTESSLAALLAQGVVLVAFQAVWSGPCRSQHEVLASIEQELRDHLTVVAVDIDEVGRLGHHYEIMSVPTVLLFQQGQVVERIIGLQSKKVLLELITPYLL